MARPADPNAKEALVAAARAEFARRGLVGARVEDITAACNLSKGAFYLHVESKEALFGDNGCAPAKRGSAPRRARRQPSAGKRSGSAGLLAALSVLTYRCSHADDLMHENDRTAR